MKREDIFPVNPDSVVYSVMTHFLRSHGYTQVEPDTRRGENNSILWDMPGESIRVLSGVSIRGNSFAIERDSIFNPEVAGLVSIAKKAGIQVIYNSEL